MKAIVAVAGALPVRIGRSIACWIVRSCVHCTKSIIVVVPPNSAAWLTCAGGSVAFRAAPARASASGNGRAGRCRRESPACPVASTVRAAAGSEPGAPIIAIFRQHADIRRGGAARQHAGAAGDHEVQHHLSPVVMAVEARRIAGGEAAQNSWPISRTMKTSRLRRSASGQGSSQCGGYSVCCTAWIAAGPALRSANATMPFTRSRSSPRSCASPPNAREKSSRDIGRRSSRPRHECHVRGPWWPRSAAAQRP